MTKSRYDKLLLPTKAQPTKARKAAKQTAAEPGHVETTETQEITITRVVGKRSKDSHTQVSAYIPKATHKRVKAALLDDERDFSELVSDLLAEWLKNRE